MTYKEILANGAPSSGSNIPVCCDPVAVSARALRPRAGGLRSARRRFLRIVKLLLALFALLALENAAAAQGTVAASIGNVFGGEVPSKKGVYAVAIGGGGAHAIGSELEFSESRHFFDTPDGEQKGSILTLMASILVNVPVGRVRPYAIFGYGFIRERTESSVGNVFSTLSDKDVGYNVGGGVKYQFARHAAVRVDLRHFKVRRADGLSFQRMLIGVVLGG